MRTKYLLLVGLAALLGSCQNENEPKTSSVPGTEGDYRIIIEGDETDSPSRAGEKSFVGGTASGAGLYDGDKTAIVSATPNSDYEIDYFWGGPASDPDKYTTSSTAATTYKVGINGQDHTFHLKFKEKKREVTINAGTGGRVNPSGTTDYKVLKAHNITATPNSGYEFTGWSVSGSGITLGNSSSASTTFTLASNYSSNGTITANFKESITVIYAYSTPETGDEIDEFYLKVDKPLPFDVIYRNVTYYIEWDDRYDPPQEVEMEDATWTTLYRGQLESEHKSHRPYITGNSSGTWTEFSINGQTYNGGDTFTFDGKQYIIKGMDI